MSTGIDPRRPPRAWGAPPARGVMRARPEDFVVEEVPGFEPDGEGEHALLKIRKRGLNTADLAARIARLAGVRRMDVGYAGLKDRNAVTTQWFSVALAGRPEPDWRALEREGGVTVLEATRHRRKLRRGALRGNRFRLVVESLEGDLRALEARLEQIAAEGVPNYFGEQRFGRDNLARAEALFRGELKVRDRTKRGLYLSAARAALFNHLLALRVEEGSWNRGRDGDVLALRGSASHFHAENLDEALHRRIESHDLSPTGPLWGRGEPATSGEPGRLERNLGERFPLLCQGLERAGLKQERRPLRLLPEEFSWQLEPGRLTATFFLAKGSYATAVMGEALEFQGSSD